jgi:methylphosphotriester-DNA--protein-cysteine methyltransferase
VAAIGQTPARFVESARLDAARMLLSRGVSLKSVAAQVGLFPAARLTEAFERRFGIAQLFLQMHASLSSPPSTGLCWPLPLGRSNPRSAEG